MKQIIVGGHEVEVPNGYIQAEAEYTKDATAVFRALSPGKAKEAARAEVLLKRTEFYDLYTAGKANVTPSAPAKTSTFRKIYDWAISHKWL